MNYLKNILYSLLIVLFLSSGSFAMQSNSVLSQIEGSSLKTYSVDYENLSGSVKIVGSPLFKGEFTDGKVIFSSELVSNNVKLNYDTYTNQVIFVENDSYFVVPNQSIKGFYFLDGNGNTTEAFLSGFESKKENVDTETYMEIIYNGDVKLFNYHYTKYRKDEANIYNPRETDYYTNNSKYLLMNKDGDLKKIKLKESDILKALGNNKNELKKFIQDNALYLGNTSDVKKLLSYYDTLNMK
ncbi:MAG: hypothetical protein JJ892_13535 [Balneola sp.]|nr:hypothetical protein [Balneola sp.]MBO6649536.1 hypothetical protein [Balneola sp.]MBO6711353.1 hypothetical protein [Balneola sp.]MBO6801293.1 hypothetical protein [Balneola sp.]MBO6869289.1 hypothetical protein [Balneola sp.]